MMKSISQRVKQGKGKDQEALTAFIAGAEDDPLITGSHFPWDGLDPKEPVGGRGHKPKSFALRLNRYELAQLQWLSEQRDNTMQRVVKALIREAVQAELSNQGL